MSIGVTLGRKSNLPVGSVFPQVLQGCWSAYVTILATHSTLQNLLS